MTSSPPPRISESAALSVALTLPGQRIVCTSIGRGQAARGLWRDRADATVTLIYLDQFQQRLAIADHEAERAGGNSTDSRLQIECLTDLPDQEFELAVIPCSVRGEAELQRDFLQQAYAKLATGGRLVSSVDNPRDKWLHEQMQQFETKVSATRTENAAVYVVVKDKPLRRMRSFHCEFTFRDCDQTIHAVSRPGVFSHRHLDSGAAALIDAVHLSGGDRVLDVGCGSGVVSLALAKRNPQIHVLAIDSNARAVECTALGAAKNELANVHWRLSSDGECDQSATYDIAVCNPPYYSNFKIAELFIDASRRALKPGGRIYIVTKTGQWYEENLYPGWRDITITQGKQYAIVEAIRG